MTFREFLLSVSLAVAPLPLAAKPLDSSLGA